MRSGMASVNEGLHIFTIPHTFNRQVCQICHMGSFGVVRGGICKPITLPVLSQPRSGTQDIYVYVYIKGQFNLEKYVA